MNKYAVIPIFLMFNLSRIIHKCCIYNRKNLILDITSILTLKSILISQNMWWNWKEMKCECTRQIMSQSQNAPKIRQSYGSAIKEKYPILYVWLLRIWIKSLQVTSSSELSVRSGMFLSRAWLTGRYNRIFYHTKIYLCELIQ